MPDLATVPLLLVEDNEEDALLLQTAFESLAFPNPFFALSSARHAIDYLRGVGPYANRCEFPLPSIVLVSAAMPEVMRLIRKTPSLSHLFVVALTSSEPTQAAIEAAQMGADSYLIKPADGARVGELFHLLRKHWPLVDRMIEFRREMADSALAHP